MICIFQGTVTYQSVLTFAPTALDNEIDILCNASIDSSTGLASYSPSVIRECQLLTSNYINRKR